MNWKLWLIVIALGALAFVGWRSIEFADGELSLTILHTNDLHAHYEPFQPWGEAVQGGAARLSTSVREIRMSEENVLLLDAGDQFQGTLFFNVGGAELVAAIMNELSYDAMVIGNHEFDSGPQELATLISSAEFPVLSANIDANGDRELQGLVPSYEIIPVAGDAVAVFGLTSEHTAIASNPGPDVLFLGAIETAQDVVNEILALGVNKIIALTHLGFERDLELAMHVSGIDIIVGGHSHSLLGDFEGSEGLYPHVLLSAGDEPVVVVTAHEWGRMLGRVDVLFDCDGLVLGAEGEPIPITDVIEEDPGVLEILADVVPQIEALKGQTVGETSVDLDGDRLRIRSEETTLGNLICDAMLWKVKAFGAQAALHNGGGIRASIPAGPITMGQVLEVLPFGNQITLLELTGAQLLAVLENSVSQIEDGAGRFAHVAGLRYRFDRNAATDTRIRVAEIWDEETDGFVAILEDSVYTVATNSFLAGGGDDYASFAQAEARYDTGFLLSDTLAEYLRVASPVVPEVEGRIAQVEEEE